MVLGNSEFTLTSGAYISGESVASVSLTASNSYDSSTTQSAGTYADEIAISNAVGSGGFLNDNYDILYDSGDLSINRRPIELTANDQSKAYGDVLVQVQLHFLRRVEPTPESATAVVLSSANSNDSIHRA